MKDNRIAKMFSIGAAGALAATAAFGQTTTSVGAHVGPVGVGVTNSTGAFVGAPGTDYFSFRTEAAAEPVKYYYTPETTIVDSTGRTVTWKEVRTDMPASVEYMKQGDRMVVKTVHLSKPVTETTEKTTTTTTTVNP